MNRLRNIVVATHRGALFFGGAMLYPIGLPMAAAYVAVCLLLDPEEVDRMVRR